MKELLTPQEAQEVDLSINPFKQNRQIEDYLGQMGVHLLVRQGLLGLRGRPNFYRRKHLISAAGAVANGETLDELMEMEHSGEDF